MGCWAFLGVIAAHPLGREAITVIQYLQDSSARSVWKQGHLVELSCPLLWAAVRPVSASLGPAAAQLKESHFLERFAQPFWESVKLKLCVGVFSHLPQAAIRMDVFPSMMYCWTFPCQVAWYILLFESKCPSTPREARVCSLLLCVCTMKSVSFKVVLNWFWFTLWWYYK